MIQPETIRTFWYEGSGADGSERVRQRAAEARGIEEARRREVAAYEAEQERIALEALKAAAVHKAALEAAGSPIYDQLVAEREN